MAEKELFKPGNRKYIYAVGRRKSATAQIRLYPKGKGVFVVNNKTAIDYFQNQLLVERAFEALGMNNLLDSFDATVLVSGGGRTGQSDAIRLGIARALLSHDEALKPQIRVAGMLTRDSRVKERKKYGLRGARRAPQWSKR